jgi:hypothetical protein
MKIEFEKNYKEVSLAIGYDWGFGERSIFLSFLFWNVWVWF